MDQEALLKDQQASASGETMFLVTFQNQIYLINIADNKANLLITINSIIISVIVSVTGLGVLSKSVELSKHFILFPIICIIITSLISVVLSIQAARPQVKNPNNMAKKGAPEKTSLIFFANMSNKSMDEYIREMEILLSSRESVREHMVIDIFNQGKVLSRKYSLLNLAYLVFMYGFILSVITFLVMLLI